MKKLRKYSLTCILIVAILVTWSSMVFSQTKYASCYGFYYDWVHDTTGNATYAGACYEIQGYASFVYHDYDANFALNHLSTDDIFFYSGHGHYTELIFYDGKNKDDTDNDCSNSYLQMEDVEEKDLSGMTLAVLAGCNTADFGSNITTTFHEQGATCAVGWENTLRVPQKATWLEHFNGSLSNNSTVNQAIQTADTRTFIAYLGFTGGTDSHYIAGSGNITIN
ncbi:hypothetical protein RBH29_11020 [Herbivorax sp. ANBcel31]|uniref:hypothetical protein n=1 Tax=Herbivorax sp. ANBcel31 TaxID=3069754 RepID=UPI0027B1D9D9|nr:hypothetical protein [Herbivorax sp. ANBcel31]MDQ2086959.1 hypothetical protein [Herbivorax sp. ANBcel31]